MKRYEELKNIPVRGKMVDELNLFCITYPLERPRQGAGGHFYTPRDNQKGLYKEVNYYAKHHKKPIDYPVIIDCFFYFEYVNSEHVFPVARKYGDQDNLLKSIYDSLAPHTKVIHEKLIVNKILHDDALIVGGESFKVFDLCDDDGNSDSYTVVRIYEARSGK